jgi:hypothetical protein
MFIVSCMRALLLVCMYALYMYLSMISTCMSVFPYVCKHACIHLCMYVSLHACTCGGLSASSSRMRTHRGESRPEGSGQDLGVQPSVHLCEVLSVCFLVCMYVCMYVCMCVYMHVYMHVCYTERFSNCRERESFQECCVLDSNRALSQQLL